MVACVWTSLVTTLNAKEQFTEKERIGIGLVPFHEAIMTLALTFICWWKYSAFHFRLSNSLRSHSSMRASFLLSNVFHLMSFSLITNFLRFQFGTIKYDVEVSGILDVLALSRVVTERSEVFRALARNRQQINHGGNESFT